MMRATTTITRKRLYDQVWSEAIIRLAQRYGMSNVGLAKICRKHDIPRPPRGYWAKKEFGKAPPKIPLPNPKNDYNIEIRDPSERRTRPSPVDQETRDKVEDEKQKAIRIEVAETLRGSHELVSLANQQLQLAKTDEDCLVIPPEGLELDIIVSKASLRRALLIMDALLKAMEQRGYKVESGPTIGILDVQVGFGIKESLRTEKEEPKDHDLDGPYAFGHSRFNQKRAPSGLLTLEIDEGGGYWSRGYRRAWRDSPKHGSLLKLSTLAGEIPCFVRFFHDSCCPTRDPRLRDGDGNPCGSTRAGARSYQ
jgi:hypothetical protein